MSMKVFLPKQALTPEDAEQVRRAAQHCALCNRPSSETDGGVVLIKASPDFPYNVVASLGSCCIGAFTGPNADAAFEALRELARKQWHAMKQ